MNKMIFSPQTNSLCHVLCCQAHTQEQKHYHKNNNHERSHYFALTPKYANKWILLFVFEFNKNFILCISLKKQEAK